MIIGSRSSRLIAVLDMLEGAGREEKTGHDVEKGRREYRGYGYGYVSGEQMSRALNISREAVWKYISMLRGYGYTIDAKPRLGYMLVGVPDRLYPWEIMKELGECSIVSDIIYYGDVESTQDVALRLAERGRDSILVVAERQSKGRGRLSRRWVSPDGGLWFSLIVRPRISTGHVTLLSLATALAVCNAIRSLNLPARIKWPNDVLINHRKVAGILIDMSMEHDRINYAVVGVGINANVSIESIESRIGDADRESYYGSTSLMHELGRAVDRVRLTALLLKELEGVYSRLAHRADILAAIREVMLFGPVRVVEGGGEAMAVDGVAMDIDDDGSLLVKSDHGVKRITSGYVRIRHM
ncbi:MAG: biotin--[acetyl-CoA-carboxylase] ligase [Candidatus Nitrosocaldus sp.]|nr:biotin--[acetyl-CoA-carboxylase] ligase [Candidatus Nitrosocaldus sp.]